MGEEVQVVALDNGSHMIKAGFCGDDAPRTVFPSIIGRSNYQNIMSGMNERDYYIGDEALCRRDMLALKYPIKNGFIENWDDMEKVWHHTLHYEMRVEPKEKPVLLTESIYNTKPQREKTMQIMFETFEIPSFQFAYQELAAMYAAGRVTGVTVYSGHDMSTIFPIFEGHCCPKGVAKIDIGGSTITDYFINKLRYERGYDFSSNSEYYFINDIKEKLCYVAEDYDKELKKNMSELEKSYQLPDGNIVTVGKERFTAPEILFNPSILRMRSEGLQTKINQSIMNCDFEMRKDFYSNIVLAGGTTKFEGIQARLTKEIRDLAPSAFVEKVKVLAPPERKYSAWIGISILGSLSSFEDKWITKKEYDEFGPALVERRVMNIWA